jgi:hypothetical protein
MQMRSGSGSWHSMRASSLVCTAAALLLALPLSNPKNMTLPPSKGSNKMESQYQIPTRAQLRISQIKLTYLGPQEKPIPSLIIYSTTRQLTDTGLTNLAANGLPSELQIGLRNLVEREYLSRSNFRQDLEKTIGAENWIRYGARVQEVSTQKPGRELALENHQAVHGNGRPYESDHSPYMKSFGATPEEIRKVWEGANRSFGSDTVSQQEAVFSLSCIFKTPTPPDRSEFKVSGREFLLKFEQGDTLFSELAAAMDPENVEGKKILEGLRSEFF